MERCPKLHKKGGAFMTIRSGGMYAARSNSVLLPVSLEVCLKGARTSDAFRHPNRCKDA